MGIEVGIAGGVFAAVLGLFDWRTTPVGQRARTMGLIHAVINAAAVVVFGIFVPDSSLLAFALAAGWLGGEAIDRSTRSRGRRAA